MIAPQWNFFSCESRKTKGVTPLVSSSRHHLSDPDSKAFLSLARFLRTQEKLSMNRVRSFLSMRCMLLGYSFDPRLNSCALCYEHPFVNKQMLTLEKFDGRNKTGESRRSGCGDLKGLTRFSRTSFSPPRSRKRQKEALLDGCTWGGVGGQYSRGLVASSPLPFIPSYFQGSAY